MTTAMLNKYTFDGYIRWLRGIKALYKMRRNWLCDTFEDVFHIEFEDNTNGVISNQLVREVFEGMGRGVTCYAKPAPGSTRNKWDEKKGIESVHGPALVSFIPPTAGMFVWLAIHVDQHPDYKQLQAKGEDATRVLMEKLWHELADNLVCPSSVSQRHRLTSRFYSHRDGHLMHMENMPSEVTVLATSDSHTRPRPTSRLVVPSRHSRRS